MLIIVSNCSPTLPSARFLLPGALLPVLKVTHDMGFPNGAFERAYNVRHGVGEDEEGHASWEVLYFGEHFMSVCGHFCFTCYMFVKRKINIMSLNVEHCMFFRQDEHEEI